MLEKDVRGRFAQAIIIAIFFPGQPTKLAIVSAKAVIIPHIENEIKRFVGNSLGTFRHKQASTLVAEQATISSIYRFLRVNI